MIQELSGRTLRSNNKQQKSVDCSPEEAKEVIEAFRSVFLEMKIQHIVDAKDELSFSFTWKLCGDNTQIDCGKEDGRWQELQAA
jgi:hypothetical protein